MDVNIEYVVILPFHDFPSEVKQMWHMYKFVLKFTFRQDTSIFKQTYRNVVFRDYIHEFEHMWYNIYKADYCLKHFKLVSNIKTWTNKYFSLVHV